MALADAIGSAAMEAATFQRDLITAAKRPDNQVQVQGSIALALGELGPAAKDAVPRLQMLKAIHQAVAPRHPQAERLMGAKSRQLKLFEPGCPLRRRG